MPAARSAWYESLIAIAATPSPTAPVILLTEFSSPNVVLLSSCVVPLPRPPTKAPGPFIRPCTGSMKKAFTPSATLPTSSVGLPMTLKEPTRR